MGNHSHAHGHGRLPSSLNRVFVICIVLNLLFVGIEAAAGLLFNSVGLLSDAGHNLSDVFSLLLALLAFRMSGIRANSHFTYGYKKSTVLVSLVNAVILLVAVGAIIFESISRFGSPVDVPGTAVAATAGAGIIVNGLTAVLLMKDQKKDLNVRGAYLHMFMDTVVSVGVVISGIVIGLTGLEWIDPAISLVIAAVILVSTFNMLKESLYLSLDAVPSSVDIKKIESALDRAPGVAGWHHLHIWPISTTENAATLHVVVDNISEMENVKGSVKKIFEKEGVSHCTIETETTAESCSHRNCI